MKTVTLEDGTEVPTDKITSFKRSGFTFTVYFDNGRSSGVVKQGAHHLRSQPRDYPVIIPNHNTDIFVITVQHARNKYGVPDVRLPLVIRELEVICWMMDPSGFVKEPITTDGYSLREDEYFLMNRKTGDCWSPGRDYGGTKQERMDRLPKQRASHIRETKFLDLHAKNMDALCKAERTAAVAAEAKANAERTAAEAAEAKAEAEAAEAKAKAA